MGTADFAVPALEAVKDDVVLVVTQPDKPSGRGMVLKPSPVKALALDLGLIVESPNKSRSAEFIDHIRSLDADVLLVAAYGQILSAKMLETTKRGGINLHGSLLPKYRGAAPIQRCVQSGDTETGVTLMQMDVGMDTGNIIAVEKATILPDETAGELFRRLAGIAAKMATEWMPRICTGEYESTPQDNGQATHAAKIDKSEAQLEFSNSSQQEYNRFRAFTPFPGAFLRTTQGHVKISSARLGELKSMGAGVVVQTKPDLIVGFTPGSIALLELQPEGKKSMSGAAWANGARISVGDCLSP